MDYLLTVFIQNGYPEKTVWRILYQESKPKGTKEEIDFSKAMYVPYHPRTKRLYRMIKEEFGFSIIYKKHKHWETSFKRKAARSRNNTGRIQCILSLARIARRNMQDKRRAPKGRVAANTGIGVGRNTKRRF